MQEEILHHIWQRTPFAFSELKTVQGNTLRVLTSGQPFLPDYPDFFNSQLLLDSQKWAGNVEVAVRASEWYRNERRFSQPFRNLILLVVWECDTKVRSLQGCEIPVLELKRYISKESLWSILEEISVERIAEFSKRNVNSKLQTHGK